MPRIGLSASDVATAYDALCDAGLQPSIRAIRAHLGNTGSLKTIADHVRALKSERWQTPGPALPDPLLKSLVTGAEAFWAELAEAADAHIEANNAQCTSQLESMNAERNEAINEAASMRDALSAHKTHITSLETQLAESANRQASGQQHLEEAREKLDQSRAQVTSLNSAMLSLTHERDEAQRLLGESQRSVDALQNQLQSQEREHQTIQLARDHADNATALELAEVLDALSVAKQSLDQWESENALWEQDRKSLNTQIETLQHASVVEQDQIRRLQKEISTLQSDNATLNTQIDLTASLANEAEKKQQVMLKALSAEFAIIVREARSVEQDSSSST